jgi:hypothetical protein
MSSGFAGGPGGPGPVGDPGDPGSASGTPSEDQLRAAYEAELKRLRVEHLLLEHVVGMVNLGMRRTGLEPGTEEERDPAQVRLAIESIRLLMPLLEQTAPQQVGQIRAALSQLQLSFVRIGGQPGPGAEAAGPEGGPRTEGAPGSPGSRGAPAAPAQPGPASEPGGPGPAQRSGRLWIPGQ